MIAGNLPHEYARFRENQIEKNGRIPKGSGLRAEERFLVFPNR